MNFFANTCLKNGIEAFSKLIPQNKLVSKNVRYAKK